MTDVTPDTPDPVTPLTAEEREEAAFDRIRAGIDDAARQPVEAETGLGSAIDAVAAALDEVDKTLDALPAGGETEDTIDALGVVAKEWAALVNAYRAALQAAPAPILDATNATERERIAYGRGLNGKAIDGSHIPGSEAER